MEREPHLATSGLQLYARNVVVVIVDAHAVPATGNCIRDSMQLSDMVFAMDASRSYVKGGSSIHAFITIASLVPEPHTTSNYRLGSTLQLHFRFVLFLYFCCLSFFGN